MLARARLVMRIYDSAHERLVMLSVFGLIRWHGQIL